MILLESALDYAGLFPPASLGMAEAWRDNDRDKFTDALAEAVAKLAIISANDCPE